MNKVTKSEKNKTKNALLPAPVESFKEKAENNKKRLHGTDKNESQDKVLCTDCFSFTYLILQ